MRKVLQGSFYLLLGGVFVWTGIQAYARNKTLKQRLNHAKGKVIKLYKVKDRERTVYPRLSFKDASGKTREFTSDLTFTKQSIAVGDTLLLLYNPKKPQEEVFIYNDFNSSWLPWVLIIVGGIFLTAGGFVMYQAARKRTA
ncbi:hypothetical protein BKI52_06370 [marine bacterium AO1-C]|nr:hypothetical protein BKI52_06370 [marine bacterium AO1-C]